MYKHKKPTFYSNLKSPFKSIGGVSPFKGLGEGIGQLLGAKGAKRRAEEEQGLADTEFGGAKSDYLNMDFSNPYANMENTMEDLTINQKGMELQNQKGQQTRANTMQNLQGAAGGSGIAALAQTMANQGQLAAQKSGEMIGNQEQANQAKAMEGADAVQTAKMQGAKDSRQLQYDKTSNLMNMSAGEASAAGAAKTAAGQAQGDAVAGIGGAIAGGAGAFKK